MYIGYDDTNHHVYQSNRGTYGHAIWPNPILTQSQLIVGSTALSMQSTHISDIKIIFLEESFNPLTRIKRGYLYKRSGNKQPNDWTTTLHPTDPRPTPRVSINENPYKQKQLWEFEHYRITYDTSVDFKNAKLLIGNGKAISCWKIIQIETNLAGEEFLTIKSLSNMGVLPEVNTATVPSQYIERVKRFIDLAVDAAYQSNSENIIDRCRDGASLLFNIWYERTSGNPTNDDLQKTITKLENLVKTDQSYNKRIAFNSGRTIAILHSRSKPNEQEKRNTPHICEDDGQLALQCLSSIMRELGFAH